MARLETIFGVIKRPHISPKAARLNQSKLAQLVVIVDKHATKPDIKVAIEKLFGVQAVSVNTLIMKGKRKRSGGRYTFYNSTFKKAIVTLKQGQQIADLEGTVPFVDNDQLGTTEES